MHIETACGAVAGGLAGFLTTPLDVMKTLLQTQVKKPSVCSARHTHGSVYVVAWRIMLFFFNDIFSYLFLFSRHLYLQDQVPGRTSTMLASGMV